MSDPFEALLRQVAAAPPLPTRDPWLGRRIGRYLVLSRPGSGATGVVYRAHDTRLSRDVAGLAFSRIDASGVVLVRD